MNIHKRAAELLGAIEKSIGQDLQAAATQKSPDPIIQDYKKLRLLTNTLQKYKESKKTVKQLHSTARLLEALIEKMTKQETLDQAEYIHKLNKKIIKALDRAIETEAKNVIPLNQDTYDKAA